MSVAATRVEGVAVNGAMKGAIIGPGDIGDTWYSIMDVAGNLSVPASRRRFMLKVWYKYTPEGWKQKRMRVLEYFPRVAG